MNAIRREARLLMSDREAFFLIKFLFVLVRILAEAPSPF